MKSQSCLLLHLFTLSWGPGSLSSCTSDPMETAGPAELAVCFQARLKASAAVPGPIPCLNPRLGRRTGLWLEVRLLCSSANTWSTGHVFSCTVFFFPTLTHFSFPYWYPSVGPSIYFMQYLWALMIFYPFFFSPSFFFPQQLLLALPPLFHCLIQIVSIHFLHPSLCRLLSTSRIGW